MSLWLALLHIIAKKRTWTADVRGMVGGKPQLRESVVISPYLIREAGSIVPYPFSSLLPLVTVPLKTPHDQSRNKHWAIALVANDPGLLPLYACPRSLGRSR